MTDTRKGFLKPEQEEKLDKLMKFDGLAEALDGPAIKLADNQGLERLKDSLNEKFPEALPIVYEVIDTLIDALPTPTED